MTTRKAIEAALERWIEARRHVVAVDVEDVIAGSCVEKAYKLGRIAGLREAARIVDPPPDSPCCVDADYEFASNWQIQSATYIRARADRLAKKARAR